MLRYHVTCGLEKKVASVDNSDNALQIILDLFSVGPDTTHILQVWDPVFEDFVNVEDASSLPHLSKLQLLIKANLLPVASPLPSAAPSVPQSSSSVPQLDTLQAESSSPESRAWPLVYCLQVITQQLHSDILKARSLVDLDSAVRRRLIRVLYEDMVQYTIYPTSYQYSEVCKAVLVQYPSLRDKTAISTASTQNLKHSVRPYETLITALTTKFKYERQPLTDPSVVLNRQKFASKRPVASPAVENLTEAKKKTRVQPELVDGAENDDTVSCHIKTMQTELNKNTPNIATIEDRMQRTLAVRRAAVKEKLRFEILEEYPALRMDAELNNEVRRITGKDIQVSMKKFFTAGRVEKLLKFVQTRKLKPALPDEVFAAVGKAEDYDLPTQRLGCLMLVLPAAFKESCAFWYSINKSPDVFTPAMSIKVAHTDVLFDLDLVKISTFLDNQQVTSPPDFLSAVSSLVALYWVLDVEFPKQLSKTLSFLAGHICDLMPFKSSSITQQVCNVLYS